MDFNELISSEIMNVSEYKNIPFKISNYILCVLISGTEGFRVVCDYLCQG